MNKRNRPMLLIVLALSLFTAATLYTAEAQNSGDKNPAASIKKTKKVGIAIDPDLPYVLIIGDSISLGYTPYVQKMLEGKFNVIHAPGNNSGTTKGLLGLTEWLGGRKWDLIHFNWGLHDLKHVQAGNTAKNSNDPGDPQQADLAAYTKNMKVLVKQIKKTGARLIFATTTPYPAGVSPLRVPEDAAKYNKAALGIMKENGIKTNDLYALVLPRLEKIQKPKNVHFHPEGSEMMAKQVVKMIKAELD